MFELINTSLMELANNFVDANKRLFWPYLLSALLIGVIIFYIKSRHKKNTSLVAFLFPKKVWLSSSAKHDYALFFINRVIKTLLIAPLLFGAAGLAISTSQSLEAIFGTSPNIVLNSASLTFIFTLILFLFDDFSRFLLHYLLHKTPILWHFHQVHHSATQLTPMTIFRSHPVENLLYAFRMIISQGLALGLCFYLFGPRLQILDILGANAFIFIFNIAGSNLRHSHIWLPWGKLEHIFISPAQHQLHHSADPKHYDKNFGTALSIWDRLFSCFLASKNIKGETLKMGIKGFELHHQSILSIYWQPFKFAYLSVVNKFKH